MSERITIRRGGLRGFLNRAVNYITGQESVIVPIYKQAAGEYPPVTFRDMRDYYTKDADVQAAVNFIANRALSRGYHIECNSDAPNHEEAEEWMTDWLNQVRWGDRRNERGFEPLLRIITRELGWGGTSMVEMIDPALIEALAQVQLSSIWRYQRDEFGNLRYIWQYPEINPRPLTPERYVIFQWNLVDRNPFGYGLVHALAQWRVGPNGNIIPPPILRKWQIEDDIGRRLHRYGSPRSIYQFKGLSKNEIKEYGEILKDPEADASFSTNAEVGISMDTPQGRPNFGPDLDYFDTRIQAGLGTPLIKLLTSTGFTQASSTTAAELGDIIVWDMQSVLKSTVENEILGPVLEQNGFDSNLLKPKFEFNIPDEPEEWTVADILKAATPDPTTGQALIKPAEARKLLRTFAKWELDDDPTPEPHSGNLVTQPERVVAEQR